MSIKKYLFDPIWVPVLLLCIFLSVGLSDARAQSTYSLSHQTLSGGGGRGAAGELGVAHTMGQPAPVGIGCSELYDLISGAYGTISVATSSGDLPLMPHAYLYQNYPNPFNPSTTIEYSVGTRGRVEIEIYDINGRRIRSLVDQIKDPGRHRTVWDGKNEFDQTVATGIYFCRLRIGAIQSVRKMLVIR